MSFERRTKSSPEVSSLYFNILNWGSSNNTAAENLKGNLYKYSLNNWLFKVISISLYVSA